MVEGYSLPPNIPPAVAVMSSTAPQTYTTPHTPTTGKTPFFRGIFPVSQEHLPVIRFRAGNRAGAKWKGKQSGSE
jgi:hypothetical protein